MKLKSFQLLPATLLLLFATMMAGFAQATEDAYSPSLVIDGLEGEVRENVFRHVRLAVRLADEVPVSASEVGRLQGSVTSEIRAAVEPYGYYRASVQRLTASQPDQLHYQVTLGEPVLIENVSIELRGAGSSEPEFVAWQQQFPLTKGQALDQLVYEQRKKSLLSTALQFGYFDARFVQSQILINAARDRADIVLTFDAGQRYSVRAINYFWNDTELAAAADVPVDIAVLQALTAVTIDTPFNADLLVSTQQDLLASNYFGSVNARAGLPDRQNALVDVEIRLTPGKRLIYGLELGAGTDTGVRGGIGFENRLFNRAGHSLSARFGGSEIRRSAIANYRIPLARRSTDSWNFFAAYEEELGDSRNFDSLQIGTEFVIEWRKAQVKIGIVASDEKSTRLDSNLNERKLDTRLLIPSLSWERLASDDVWFPTRGWSAKATLRGSSEAMLSDVDLAQLIVDARFLRPLGDGRLKARIKTGLSAIDDAVLLPESLGFLAGGDDSVRGYKYESIGAQRNGETVVGKNLLVASIEYQHPLRDGWALAGFVDVGSAFDNDPDFKRGVGFGLRWRLPFGALRLDLASALDRDGDPWRIHFNIGTDL